MCPPVLLTPGVEVHPSTEVMPMAKTTVEDCFILDVNELLRASYGCPGYFGTGPLRWGKQVWGFFWYLMFEDGLRVYWPLGPTDSYVFRLERTPTAFGGERAWFQCPRCTRPVSKLYMPWGQADFWCRHCHDLTYKSRQERIPPLFKALTLFDQLQALEQATPPGRHILAKKMRLLTRINEIFAELNQARAQRKPPPSCPWPRRGRGRPRTKRPYVRRTPLALSPRTTDSQGYCVKCRDRREMNGIQPVTLTNGRAALQGHCSVCGALVTRIVKAEAASLGEPGAPLADQI